MPNIESAGVLKKDWPVLLLVEKSDDVNTMLRIFDTFKSVVQEISDIQDNSPYCNIKIGTYAFSDISHFNHPLKIVGLSEYDISDFLKNDVVDLTDVLRQLSTDLSRKVLFNGEYGYYLPILIFIFDGNKKYITDEALEQMSQNRWFQNAKKIAFVVNDCSASTESELLKLVRHKEAIIYVNNTRNVIDFLKQLLVCTSVPSSGPLTGSIIANHSCSTDDSVVFVDPLFDVSEDSWGDDSW